MGKERDNWVDIVKGFAILCVVVGHSCERLMTGLSISPVLIEYLDYFCNSFHMPLFFMASGYIYRGTRNRGNDSKFSTFFKKKVLDLLLPYTWFAILIWIGKFIFSNFVVRKVSILDLLQMFIDPVAFMWFIYLLFFISVFIWILEKVTSDNSLIILMILIPMTCTWMFYKSGNVLADRFLFYPLYYYIGVILCKKQNLLKSKIILFGSAIIYVVLFLPYCTNGTEYFYKIIVNLTGSVFFFTLIYNVFQKKRLNAFEWLGKNTMFIYILHPIVLNAARMILIKLSVTNVYFWFITLHLAGLGIPVIYAMLAKHVAILQMPFKPRQFIECRKGL